MSGLPAAAATSFTNLNAEVNDSASVSSPFMRSFGSVSAQILEIALKLEKQLTLRRLYARFRSSETSAARTNLSTRPRSFRQSLNSRSASAKASGASSFVDSSEVATPVRRQHNGWAITPRRSASDKASWTIGKSSKRFSAGNRRFFSSMNLRLNSLAPGAIDAIA